MSGISKNQAARLTRLTYRHERQPAYSVPDRQQPLSTPVEIREGYLAQGETLESPTEEQPTTEAKMLVYKGRGPHWQKHTLNGEDEKITVTNRDRDFSAAENERLLAIRMNGEWRPLSASGGAMALGVLKEGNGITGRSENVPGRGKAKLERLVNDVLVESPTEVDVYNSFTFEIEPVEQDTYIHLDKIYGKWWISGADCLEPIEDVEPEPDEDEDPETPDGPTDDDDEDGGE